MQRAQESIYWPGMSKELKEETGQCEICLENSSKQPKETLQNHEFGKWSWKKIGIDLMKWNANNYLVIVEYYSNFIEVGILHDLTGKAIIGKLRALFLHYGIPEIVISDGGPPFPGNEFQEFAKKWNFKHTWTSSGNLRSNRKVESAVTVLNSLFKKAESAKSYPYLSLLDFRNTPQQDMDTAKSYLQKSSILVSIYGKCPNSGGKHN